VSATRSISYTSGLGGSAPSTSAGHRYSSGRLPLPLCPVAGWEVDDAAGLDVYAVVAEHDPPDRDGPVHIGGGFATIASREQTVAELPDGRFDADALAGDRNAWFWFGVVDDAWRGSPRSPVVRGTRSGLATRGADMAFAFGWEHPGRTSRPLFEAFRFVPVERFRPTVRGRARRVPCL